MDNVSYEIKSNIQWMRSSSDEGPASFKRKLNTNHKVLFSGRQEIEVSVFSKFGGDPEKPSPEELFISSVSSCLMLTFLELAQKNKLMVKSYRDESAGKLSRDEEKRWGVTYILLRPRIVLLDVKDSDVRGRAVRLLHEAHYYCFLVNSIKASVDIEPLLVIEEDI
jgi:organic hydroperoxide reductase OsmC/OhrA